ncbi:hypothetical protein F5Y14DRAFT_459928 [Nemania sp. NC0429]|nr:hypothetical protein F5Y14DRAFT_459928 [Nemania sp. NC0429]
MADYYVFETTHIRINRHRSIIVDIIIVLIRAAVPLLVAITLLIINLLILVHHHRHLLLLFMVIRVGLAHPRSQHVPVAHMRSPPRTPGGFIQANNLEGQVPLPPYPKYPEYTRPHYPPAPRDYSGGSRSAYYREDPEPGMHRRRTEEPPSTRRDGYFEPFEPRLPRRRTEEPSWTSRDEYYGPKLHRRRTEGAPRTARDENPEVLRPTSISEPESEDDTPEPEKPTLLLHPKPASDYGSESADPYEYARRKGKADLEALGTTINIILLHEWCMADGQVSTHPDSFTTGFKLLPVKRDRHGALQAIPDRSSKWGVKTGYYPRYDSYVATFLIAVPRMLSHVTPKMVKAAYRRFAAGPRSGMLADLEDIPFKDHPDYRKYAMLFKFESGREPPRLFDDYLLEDAVIRVPSGERGQSKAKSKDKHRSRK